MEYIKGIIILTISFLLFFVIDMLYISIAKRIRLKRRVKKHLYGKHTCNFCECTFIETDSELEYDYCPYCGNRLTTYSVYGNPFAED